MVNNLRVLICASMLLVALFSSAQVFAQCSHALLPRRVDVPPPSNESSSASTARANPPMNAVRTVDPDDNQSAVTVPEDTTLQVMSNQPISSRMTKPGTLLSFTVTQDVTVNGLLVIPCGVTAWGTIINTQKAGVLTGSAQLIFELKSLELGRQSYPLYSYPFKVTGASKTKPTEKKIKTGAVVGAVVLGVLSHSANSSTAATQKLIGAGTGAALGAGIGTAVSAASPSPIVSIPAESEMIFTLSSPVAVVPVDAKEAMRLARGMKPGGPVLYMRDESQ